MNLKVFSWLWSLFIVVGMVTALVPQDVTITGNVVYKNGTAVNGNYSINASIYAGYGDLTSSFYQNGTYQFSNGFFSLIFYGLNTNWFYVHQESYAGIAVRNNSEATPRINFTSVPYALVADIANNYTGNVACGSIIGATSNLCTITSGAGATINYTDLDNRYINTSNFTSKPNTTIFSICSGSDKVTGIGTNGVICSSDLIGNPGVTSIRTTDSLNEQIITATGTIGTNQSWLNTYYTPSTNTSNQQRQIESATSNITAIFSNLNVNMSNLLIWIGSTNANLTSINAANKANDTIYVNAITTATQNITNLNSNVNSNYTSITSSVKNNDTYYRASITSATQNLTNLNSNVNANYTSITSSATNNDTYYRASITSATQNISSDRSSMTNNDTYYRASITSATQNATNIFSNLNINISNLLTWIGSANTNITSIIASMSNNDTFYRANITSLSNNVTTLNNNMSNMISWISSTNSNITAIRTSESTNDTYYRASITSAYTNISNININLNTNTSNLLTWMGSATTNITQLYLWATTDAANNTAINANLSVLNATVQAKMNSSTNNYITGNITFSNGGSSVTIYNNGSGLCIGTC